MIKTVPGHFKRILLIVLYFSDFAADAVTVNNERMNDTDKNPMLMQFLCDGFMVSPGCLHDDPGVLSEGENLVRQTLQTNHVV